MTILFPLRQASCNTKIIRKKSAITHTQYYVMQKVPFLPVQKQLYITKPSLLLSDKNAQIQKIMLTPLRYTPSDTKIIKNKVLPQKMWICGKIYFERFFNYFPFYYIENSYLEEYIVRNFMAERKRDETNEFSYYIFEKGSRTLE